MAVTRRPMALAAAVATVTALGATAFALPALAADGPPKAPLNITGGTLDWGVKESYRSYVTGMAAGETRTADGAVTNTDGSFRFGGAQGAYDPGAHTVKAAFDGSVTFSSPAPPKGHGFEVTLSDLRFDSGAQRITADVTKDGGTRQDVPLAEVKATGASMEDLPATLTKEAGDVLGSATYAGAAGDPVTVRLEFASPTDPGTGPSTDPSTDPSAGPSTGPSTGTSTGPTEEPTGKPTGKPTDRPTAGPTSTGTPAGTPAPAGRAVDGTLSWGVKKSFRTYILSGGEISTAAGAKKSGDVFAFPLAQADLNSGKKTLSAAFDGSVRFLYSAHRLDIALSYIHIVAKGAAGTLSADVTTPQGVHQDVDFASLDLSGADYTAKDDVVQLKNVPAVFTADGAAQFANETTGSLYHAGDAIDPVTVALALSADAHLPAGSAGGTAAAGGTGGGSGTAGGSTVGGGSVGGAGGSVGGSGADGGALASTGTDIPAGVLAGAAAAVAAAGAALVAVARRRRTHG
ncbi:HtaA domain-containing protein [Streptomyces sp. NBC_01089]|uniref:HtaA domain-containing protein n=1 Tax=Streptomyces sp. NBC_01089 TaxID=2903747 RepID=UPI00386CF2E5|nr:HtaA domain-containing protein [Streptomyces sp. NBC_01089]